MQTVEEEIMEDFIDHTLVMPLMVNGEKTCYKYSFKLPAHLEMYHTPEDINSFIVDIYSCLESYLGVRVKDKGLITEVLTEFILYMLENNSTGIPRWQGFDAENFSSYAYHMWFLKQAHYYVLKYFAKGRKESKGKISLSREVFKGKKIEDMQLLNNFILPCDHLTPEQIYERKELREILESAENKLRSIEELSNTFNSKSSINKVMYKIYNLYFEEGHTLEEISKILNFKSKSTAQKYMQKVKKVMENHIKKYELPYTFVNQRE